MVDLGAARSRTSAGVAVHYVTADGLVIGRRGKNGLVWLPDAVSGWSTGWNEVSEVLPLHEGYGGRNSYSASTGTYPSTRPDIGEPPQRAYGFTGAVWRLLELLPGGTTSRGLDINESGTIVGWSDRGGPSADFTPVVWDASGVRALSIPEWANAGRADAINNEGVIVGSAAWGDGALAMQIPQWAYWGDRESRAVVWRRAQPADINDLVVDDEAWTVTAAISVNDVGQIVGYGFNGQNQLRAILLNPTASRLSGSDDPIADFMAFVNFMVEGDPRADVNGDGAVDKSDTADFLVAWIGSEAPKGGYDVASLTLEQTIERNQLFGLFFKHACLPTWNGWTFRESGRLRVSRP